MLASIEIQGPTHDQWAFGPPTPVAMHRVAAAAVDDVVCRIGRSDNAGGVEIVGRAEAYLA